MKDLAVVVPVYNEEGAIEKVIEKWTQELDKYGIDYNICAYNDGSKDNTAQILENLSEKFPRLKFVNKQNSGHGSTILQGYRENCKEYEWIFQIDSDDEMGPEGFNSLWSQKDNYDFLVGIRDHRIQSFPRKIISMVSRLTIKIFYGLNGPYDVNSPYRLMRSEKFANLFEKIPAQTFAPNVIISGFVANKKLRFYQTPVECKLRQTGEVSIQKLKLLKAAAKSFMQTIAFANKLKGIK